MTQQPTGINGSRTIRIDNDVFVWLQSLSPVTERFHDTPNTVLQRIMTVWAMLETLDDIDE